MLMYIVYEHGIVGTIMGRSKRIVALSYNYHFCKMWVMGNSCTVLLCGSLEDGQARAKRSVSAQLILYIVLCMRQRYDECKKQKSKKYNATAPLYLARLWLLSRV